MTGAGHGKMRRDPIEVLGDAAMASWKLATLLLLACGVSGMAAVAVFTLTGRPRPMAFRRATAQLVATMRWPTWLGQLWITMANLDFRWLMWSAATAAGIILLAGYAAFRRRQRRLGSGNRPGEPRLAGLFPAVAASFFGVAAVGLFVLNMSRSQVFFLPGLGVVACLVLAAGYAARMVQALLRRG
jgi:hypothetical protein